MALPLMPSAELFQPKPETGPEPVLPRSDYIAGCTCATCVGAQPVVYNGTYTGRLPSTQSIPRDAPLGAVTGFQRGVYDSTNCPAASWVHGQVRWRIPGTLQVSDASGRSQWTYDKELPDGSLVCTHGGNRGARWVPDAAPAV